MDQFEQWWAKNEERIMPRITEKIKNLCERVYIDAYHDGWYDAIDAIYKFNKNALVSSAEEAKKSLLKVLKIQLAYANSEYAELHRTIDSLTARIAKLEADIDAKTG